MSRQPEELLQERQDDVAQCRCCFCCCSGKSCLLQLAYRIANESLDLLAASSAARKRARKVAWRRCLQQPSSGRANTLRSSARPVPVANPLRLPMTFLSPQLLSLLCVATLSQLLSLLGWLLLLPAGVIQLHRARASIREWRRI